MNENSTPILHSMNRDTVNSAKSSVGSFNVTNEEALLLVKMQSESSKKRKFNFITILAFVILFVSLSMLLLPERYFMRKDTKIIVPQKVGNFLNADNFYQIEKPNSNELDSFRMKQFASTNGISSIDIVSENRILKFSELAPFIAERFINNFSGAPASDYVYGFINLKNTNPVPYLAFIVPDTKIASEIMLAQERTMYTDLLYAMKLEDNKQNELLQFENYDSVRSPARYLRDISGKTLLLYGFPMDNVLLITTSFESYEALKNRMLLGY